MRKALSVFLPLIVCLFCVLMLNACMDVFQYSPYEVSFDESQSDLNRKNLEQLNSNAVDDTVKFVLTGDSQFATDELNELVSSVNNLTNIDFVFIAGDIVQKGTTNEYKWVHRELDKLKVPYLGVVGNHDVERNGTNLFKAMFGALDYSFTYEGIKFICLNTNSREFNFNGMVPNMEWLNIELDNSAIADNIYVVSHVAPFDSFFDPDLELDYANALAENSKIRMSLHAHDHTYFLVEPYNDGVEYMLVSSVVQDDSNRDGRNYVIFKDWKTGFSFERIFY